MDKLIISYEQGYNNWYVSEFYKYFHKKLSEITNIQFEYVSLRDLSNKFGKEFTNQTSSIFNWFNLVIYNQTTDKFFVHSWYDYAPEILKYSVNNNFNVVKFSCVSNLTDSVIEEYKDKIIVQPSVYYVENWNDINLINNTSKTEPKLDKVYFNGWNHGLRENILNALSNNDLFNIRTKNNPEQFRQKIDYYSELSKHNFGLSLDGAANICYRDLELFGLEVLNLRQPLKCKTYNPIIKDVHYLEFIDDEMIQKILQKDNVESLIDDKVNELLEFKTTKEYHNMIQESKNWFLNNCLPNKQFDIILSFFEDFDIFF
jgi:hypothetical protein